MSKQETSDQVKFLVSCIRNATNGKPDFTAVADQLGIVSKAAAQKRYERMLKANGVGSPTKKAAGDDAGDGTVSSTPQSTPVKRKAPRRAVSSKTKKAKEGAEDDDSEQETKQKPKKAVAKEIKPEGSDSDLTEPPASDGADCA